MPLKCFSYVTRRQTSLLDETEWAEIEPLLKDWITSIKQYRADTGVDIETARAKHKRAVEAEQRYFELTQDTVEHPDHLWKLRMSQYGSLCPKCHKPFRTPKARMCAECGFELPKNKIAGPLAYPKGRK